MGRDEKKNPSRYVSEFPTHPGQPCTGKARGPAPARGPRGRVRRFGQPRGSPAGSGGRGPWDGPGGRLGPLRGPRKSRGKACRGTAGHGDAPRSPADWRSPKQPSEEGVGSLDPLLGLCHQLHRLTLLPRVIHAPSCRRHRNLPTSSDAPSRLSSGSDESAGAARGTRRDL